mgnify:CR=1 FL=1
MPTNDAGLFVSAEGTQGTEEVVDVADAIHYRSCPFEERGSGSIAREVLSSYADTHANFPPQSLYWGGTIETEVKASVNAGDLPELANLLKACGLAETDGVSDVIYHLAAHPSDITTAKSFTLRKEQMPGGEGKAYVAIGCLAAGFEWEWATDQPLRFRFPWIGQYKRPADIAAVTAGTYNAGVPFGALQASGNPFQFHSYDLIVRSFRGSMGMAVTPRGSGSHMVKSGYIWPPHLSRSGPVTFETEVEEVDQGAFAAWTKFEAGTAAAGVAIWAAGSRLLTMNLRNTVLRKITPQPGQPNMYRIEWTAHGVTGATGALSLTYA